MKKHTDFPTRKDFFAYLAANKKEIIELKKSAMKFTEPFGTSILQRNALKSLNTNYNNDPASGIIKRTIIGNTYNWMDSQDDVLLPGVFAKSISEKGDRIWHLHDHEQKISAKVGKPISVYEKGVSWADLGIELEGNTTALFMDSNIIKEYNPLIFNQYLSKEIDQHSVGMQYVNIEIAMNDESEKEAFALFNKHISAIGNKEKVLAQGYFFAVKEGKLIEISAVLDGSNELTPTIPNEEKNKPIEEKPKGLNFSSLHGKIKC